MNPLSLPKLTKHVTDLSGIFSSAQIESFSEQFAEHERNTTEEVVVVLFPHREGYELLDIGLKIFNENGIGQKNLNNGILLIIATEEKKIRIITGKGMEIKYSEMRCRDIIEKHLRPLLDAGRYEEILTEFQTIIREKENPPIVTTFSEDPVLFNIPKNSRTEGIALLISIGVIFFVIAFFMRSCSQSDFSLPSGGGGHSPSYSTSSDRDYGSHDSSSSYDGGGGSSNGGGYGD